MPIELKESCGVCGRSITCWGWGFDEKYVDGYECSGVLCDFADSRGCFNHYCEECFDKHSCKAFDKNEVYNE